MRCVLLLSFSLLAVSSSSAEDRLRDLQTAAIESNSSPLAHWGWDKDNYTLWGTHSNRLVPVYTFGTHGAQPGQRLIDYCGVNSPYRSGERLQKLYGTIPAGTLDPAADWLDQTNLYNLQLAALSAGRKHIILIVFDGMDWQTTRAASLFKTGQVGYQEGRGSGLHFQDYHAGGTSEFASMVTSPYCDEAIVNVDQQSVELSKTALPGGYNAALAGISPWSQPAEELYLIGRSENLAMRHAYTDSSSSASSMCAGFKTYNEGVNVDLQGQFHQTIAHQAQRQGYKIGLVTSVPISHATPAAAYAHNVSRDDYQDLTRDLLGLPSISTPTETFPGVDVLIGGGYGENRPQDNGQGENFVPGNPYLTDEDLLKIDRRSGGHYTVCQRTPGTSGGDLLLFAAEDAITTGKRLFGFFGVKGGHLPFQTADGGYNPTVGRKKTAATYTPEDIRENPTLSECTSAALKVLSSKSEPFWMMIEAGDVDWANHDNNLDNSIGAALSGDAAVKTVTDWVEQHSNWDETLVIVTGDHGHLLVIDQPEAIAGTQPPAESLPTR